MKKLITAVLALAATAVFAATLGTDTLTPAQLNTLRTGVCANGTARPLMQAGNVPGLLAWENTATATLAWNPYTTRQMYDEAPSYTTYDALAAGKRDSWERFLAADTRNPTKAKVRNWVVDVWGNATGGSNSESILLAATFAATNAQVILGGTVKTTGTVSATDLNFVGQVTELDTKKLIFQDNGQIYACP